MYPDSRVKLRLGGATVKRDGNALNDLSGLGTDHVRTENPVRILLQLEMELLTKANLIISPLFIVLKKYIKRKCESTVVSQA